MSQLSGLEDTVSDPEQQGEETQHQVTELLVIVRLGESRSARAERSCSGGR